MAAKAKRAPKKGKSRQKYSPEKRAEILVSAQKEGLTALAVQKRFGVTPVTYYSWRKKSGVGRRRGRRTARVSQPALNGTLEASIRSEIRSRLQSMMPDLLRQEVGNYVQSMLGAKRRGRPRKV